MRFSRWKSGATAPLLTGMLKERCYIRMALAVASARHLTQWSRGDASDMDGQPTGRECGASESNAATVTAVLNGNEHRTRRRCERGNKRDMRLCV
jgi:hypothetical protein